MKIFTNMRDTKLMELTELESINRKIIEVQADAAQETKEVKELEPENATTEKTRKKKKEEGV